jgi:hypothetical protein
VQINEIFISLQIRVLAPYTTHGITHLVPWVTLYSTKGEKLTNTYTRAYNERGR